MILEILPDVLLHESLTGTVQDLEEKPSSPGMKYKHYSPKAEVFLLYGTDEKIRNYMLSILKDREILR